jgi:hypothetical protein
MLSTADWIDADSEARMFEAIQAKPERGIGAESGDIPPSQENEAARVSGYAPARATNNPPASGVPVSGPLAPDAPELGLEADDAALGLDE